MSDQPQSVLFACTQNAVRSPMAEGILKRLAGTKIFVDSCGATPGELDPFIIQVMDEIGIDISRHRPKSFDDLDDGYYDLIISLSPEAQHKAVEMTRVMACDVEYWPTLDPTFIEGTRDVRLDAYRQVRDGLFERIKKRFDLGGGLTV